MSNSSSMISIASRRVGEGAWTFVVAEAGVNHDGSVERGRLLIDAAADAGADAVKFQLFRAAELVTATAPTAAYQAQATRESSQQKMLARLELGTNEFKKLKQHAERRGLVFLVTPFSVADVERAVELGSAAIKIASTDLTNIDLTGAAARTGLPVILSTGASTEAEIEAAVARLRANGAGDRLVLLHCVSSYPTPVERINLRAIETLRRRFNNPLQMCGTGFQPVARPVENRSHRGLPRASQRAVKIPVGLSDHTLSTRVGAWAAACGACVLEKHLTLNPAAFGPDHAMSLNPEQFAEYVRQVREAESALGTGRIGLTELEQEVRTAAAKSVVSTVALESGTVLDDSMVTLKRPGTGIPAGERSRLIGRRTRRAIPADTVLTWDMVE